MITDSLIPITIKDWFSIDMLLLEGEELDSAIKDHQASFAQRRADRLKTWSNYEEAKKQTLLRELQRKYEKS